MSGYGDKLPKKPSDKQVGVRATSCENAYLAEEAKRVTLSIIAKILKDGSIVGRRL